jgi:streptogramin lyase
MNRCAGSIVAVLLAMACAAPAASAAPVPQYFQLPAGYGASTGITAAPDGTVWFATGPAASASAWIGRLSPALASPGTTDGISTFPTPTQVGTGCCVHSVRSVTFDGTRNRVWFVQSDGIVGNGDPASMVPGTSAGMSDQLVHTDLDNGSGSFAPGLQDVAVGAGGVAWFTEYTTTNVSPYPGARIASIAPSLGGVVERDNLAIQTGTTLVSSRYDARPAGITTDSLGTPWFAEAEAGLPGYRVATTSGARGYTEYLITPCGPPGAACSGTPSGTGITDVAVARDGAIWFTNQLKNQVGRLVPGQTVTSYSLPAIDAGLVAGEVRAISVAPDGTMWVAEYGGIQHPNANAIIRIVPSLPTPSATVWHLGAGKYPLAIAPDSKGNVWFSVHNDSAPDYIGKLAGVVSTAPGGGPPSGGGTPITPVTVGVAHVGTPSTDGNSATVNQICVGPPADRCSLVYLISSHEYVTGFPGSHATAAAKRKKPVILGRKSLTLHGGQHKKVTIKLNAKGRKLLKRSGRLKLYFTVTQKTATGAAKRVKKTKLTFKVKRHH